MSIYVWQHLLRLATFIIFFQIRFLVPSWRRWLFPFPLLLTLKALIPLSGWCRADLALVLSWACLTTQAKPVPGGGAWWMGDGCMMSDPAEDESPDSWLSCLFRLRSWERILSMIFSTSSEGRTLEQPWIRTGVFWGSQRETFAGSKICTLPIFYAKWNQQAILKYPYLLFFTYLLFVWLSLVAKLHAWSCPCAFFYASCFLSLCSLPLSPLYPWNPLSNLSVSSSCRRKKSSTLMPLAWQWVRRRKKKQ